MKLRQILSEAPIDKYIQLRDRHPEYLDIAAKWWRDLSFNEMKEMYNKYYPFTKQDVDLLAAPPVRHKSLDQLAIWYNWKQKSNSSGQKLVESNLKLSKQEKHAFLESIRNYHQYKNDVYRTGKLKEIVESISRLVDVAEGITLSETDGWFDKLTVSRDTKRLRESYKVFEQTATEIAQLQQRLEAAYEDIGNGLSRYY